MDLSKLKPSDWLIAGGAFLFLISLFLPWYGVTEFGTDFANKGSEYFLTGWIPMILLIVTFVFAVLPGLADVNLPDEIGPLPRLQAALACAGAALVLVVLRLLIASDNVGDIDTDFKLDRKYGLIIALIAAGCVVGGAVMKSKEDPAGPSSPSGPATPF